MIFTKVTHWGETEGWVVHVVVILELWEADPVHAPEPAVAVVVVVVVVVPGVPDHHLLHLVSHGQSSPASSNNFKL